MPLIATLKARKPAEPKPEPAPPVLIPFSSFLFFLDDLKEKRERLISVVPKRNGYEVETFPERTG